MTRHFAVNVLFAAALVCLVFLCSGSYVGYIILAGLYLLVSSIGSYFIQLNYFVYSYCNGSKEKPQIAITFDDGPNEHTAQILDILRDQKALATFFCIGRNIAGNEAILKRIDSEGHIIGNHSFDHKVTFPLQSGNAIAAEIRHCQEAIASVIHKRTSLFRPPFGVTDPMISSGIEQTGVKSIGWSLRSYDTVSSSSDDLMKKLDNVSNGDIILLHDVGKQTVQVLSQFIQNARGKGFEIIPLDQLLGIDAYEK